MFCIIIFVLKVKVIKIEEQEIKKRDVLQYKPYLSLFHFHLHNSHIQIVKSHVLHHTENENEQ